MRVNQENIPIWDIFNNSTTSWGMSSIHKPRYKNLIKELIQIRESKNITLLELAISPYSYSNGDSVVFISEH